MTRTNQNNGDAVTPGYGALHLVSEHTDSDALAMHELRNHLAAIEGYARALSEELSEPRLKEYLHGILRNVARCVRVVRAARPPAEDLLPAAEEQPSGSTQIRPMGETMMVDGSPMNGLADRMSSEWPVNDQHYLQGVPMLLVEDDDDVAEVTATFLRRSGAIVSRVSDGDQVVDAVQAATAAQQPFALILLDIHMARMNGLEAIKEVRAVDKDIPIVVLTSDNAKAIRDASLQGGASGFLQKPIEYSSLASFLAAYLGADNIGELEESSENNTLSEPEPVDRTEERPVQRGPGGAPARVLVVDDNQDSAEAIALLLQRFGHEVTVAFSGESCIELLGAAQPEVVLLDLELPDMHGTQVAQRMRASGYSGKVIALSGHSDPSVKERCMRVGIDHFVTKPCSVQDLRAYI